MAEDRDFDTLEKAAKVSGWLGRPCPMCGTRRMQYQGIYGMPKYESTNEGGFSPLPTSVMPVAVLLCAHCAYVVTFAWIPTQKMASNG